jgi:hypothetical protein
VSEGRRRGTAQHTAELLFVDWHGCGADHD